MKVLLLLPDSSKTPFGGMGVHVQGLKNSKKIEFLEHTLINQMIMTENKFNDILIKQCTDFPKIKDLNGVQIVHSFDSSTSLLGYGLSKMLGVPHVMSLHLSMDHLFNQFYPSEINTYGKNISEIEISCMNAADAVIHVSFEYLSKYGGLNPNSFYQPNGINLNEWENCPIEKINLPGRNNSKKLC
jgi:hypothetical protein